MEARQPQRALRVARPPHALDEQVRPAAGRPTSKRGRTSSTGRSRSPSAASRARSRGRWTGCRCRAARLPIGLIWISALVLIALCIGVFVLRRRRAPATRGAGAVGGVVTRAARIACLRARCRARSRPGRRRAHALLEGTVPERGAALERAPGQVVLRFSEPVEIAFGAVRVFDAEGAQVQQGEPFHPDGRGGEVAVRLRGDLPDGGYTATYRVVSADSHPVSGGFVFSVGSGGGGAARRASRTCSATSRPGPVDVGGVRRRARDRVRRDRAGARRARRGAARLAARARRPGGPGEAGGGVRRAGPRRAARRRASPGALAALLALPLQAATAEGTSFWSALGAAREVLDTRFGARLGPRCRWLLAGCRRPPGSSACARHGRRGRHRCPVGPWPRPRRPAWRCAAARPRRPRRRAGAGRRPAAGERAARPRRRRMDRRARRPRAGAARRDAAARGRRPHAAARRRRSGGSPRSR